MIPNKKGKQYKLSELPEEKLKVGYYRVKITCDNKDFLKLFENFSSFKNSPSFKKCLPEFQAYTELLENKEQTVARLDEINADILAIRFIVPGLSEIKTYKLTGRLDGSKLPVCLAARAFLLNNFVGEWTSDLNVPGFNKITFVGLPGLKQFMNQSWLWLPQAKLP